MKQIFDTYKPEGFHTVSPYIMANHPELLIDFLKKAFYAIEINCKLNPENGNIANCILQIGDSCFMISQGRGAFADMRTSFYLFVNDVDAVHKNAVMQGAKVAFEPANMPYGDRQSGVIDPCGNYWWISERLKKEAYN